VAVGETFHTDGQVLNGVARWDGVQWSGFNTGTTGTVRAVASYNGDLIVAGDFGGIGGIPANGIARWTGSAWSAVGVGLPNGPASGAQVWALAVYGGELYVGGSFGLVGASGGNLARWNGTQWSSVSGGVSGAADPKVLAFGVDPAAGVLYAGGEFSSAGGVAASNLARWNGTTWTPVGGGVAGRVHALAMFQGSLHAGGTFGTAGGITARRIARFDGTSWSPLGLGIPDGSTGGLVTSLASVQGFLYVGGTFLEVNAASQGGIPSRRVARWDGTQWSGVGGLSGPGSIALALTEWSGALIIGGEFSRAGVGLAPGQSLVSTSVVAYDGSTFSQLDRGLGIDADTRVIVPYAGGLAAGGRFGEAGMSYTSPVAWFDGQEWRTIGTLTNGGVWDALVYNGDLVITGDFTAVNGMSCGTARFDGTQWYPMPGGGGSCLAIYQGQLYGGGLGQPKLWTGSGWSPLGATVIYGQINDMQEYMGRLYVAGSINQFPWSTGPGPNIAAWDGATWTSVAGGTNDGIECLHLDAGFLVAGGWFTQAGGQVAERIAWYDGTAWTGPAVPGPQAGAVIDLASFQGQLIVGGSFTTYLGFPADALVAWDGMTFSPLASNLDGAVLGLHADTAAGELWVTGNFQSVNGIPAWNVARYDYSLPLAIDIGQPSGPGTGTYVAVTGIVPGRETFTAYSFEPCPTGVGTGPWLGLCATDPTFLLNQILTPVGTDPFHFVSATDVRSFGPYPLPIGLVLEGVVFDLDGGVLGNVGSAVRYTVF
jgi:hypothetical protein